MYHRNSRESFPARFTVVKYRARNFLSKLVGINDLREMRAASYLPIGENTKDDLKCISDFADASIRIGAPKGTADLLYAVLNAYEKLFDDIYASLS